MPHEMYEETCFQVNEALGLIRAAIMRLMMVMMAHHEADAEDQQQWYDPTTMVRPSYFWEE